MNHETLRQIIRASIRKHGRNPQVLEQDLIARLSPYLVDEDEVQSDPLKHLEPNVKNHHCTEPCRICDNGYY